MNMFHNTLLVSTFAVFATSGTLATTENPTNAASNRDSSSQQEVAPVDQMRERAQPTKVNTYDHPQGITVEQERLYQLQTEFTSTQRMVAQLQSRLCSAVIAVEKAALQKKLTDAENDQRRLKRELRRQEQQIERLSRENAAE